MATFEYTAVNQQGQQKKGVLEGDAPRQIRQQLRDKGLLPLTISTAADRKNQAERPSWLSFQRKIGAEEVSMLTRQLATLAQAAIPLEEALLTIANQSQQPRVRAVMMEVRSKVLEGYSLAIAMGNFPSIFSKMYRATVDAGEKSGNLANVLERLADHVEQQQAAKKKIRHAMIYPILIVSVSIAIVCFLMLFVVPNIIEVFISNDQSLPAMTMVLITLSDGMQQYGIYGFAALCGLTILWRRLLKRETFKMRVHTYLLKMPILGKIIRLMNCARFFHTLGMLRTAGVSILEAMRIGGSLVSNLQVKKAIETATRQVREGVGISKALGDTGIFPPLSMHLIASGEKSGNLDAMLLRASAYHEEEVTTLTDTIVSLFEPIMIIVMGGIVLFIVLAILLPIFSLDQLASI
ncbi:MAG: type II secretion system inner membrane protein GspF [Gammaproteobacteria bacterium]